MNALQLQNCFACSSTGSRLERFNRALQTVLEHPLRPARVVVTRSRGLFNSLFDALKAVAGNGL